MTEEERKDIRDLCREVKGVVQKVDNLTEAVAKNKGRLDHIEAEHDILDGLLTTVAKLDGKVDVLKDAVTSGFKKTNQTVEKTTSFKNAMQFAAVVLVPIILALIGLYAALHGQHATVSTPGK